MDHRTYESFEFKRFPRIPRRFFWHVGLMIGVRLLWGIIPQAGHFWMVLIIVNVLGWMAGYGWRMASLDLRIWLDRISEEIKS